MDRIDAWELVGHLPEVGRLGKRLWIHLLRLNRIDSLLLEGGVVYWCTWITYIWMWYLHHLAIVNELKLLWELLLRLFFLHLFLNLATLLFLLSRFIVLQAHPGRTELSDVDEAFNLLI